MFIFTQMNANNESNTLGLSSQENLNNKSKKQIFKTMINEDEMDYELSLNNEEQESEEQSKRKGSNSPDQLKENTGCRDYLCYICHRSYLKYSSLYIHLKVKHKIESKNLKYCYGKSP